MDEKIIDHLKHEHNLLIGERTAETIKRSDRAYPMERKAATAVRGWESGHREDAEQF
jgi:actin-like ATPase involved in cell morphogenesis